jgi:D-alanine transaminase
MSRVAYVDGQYLPQKSPAVHNEDRGHQFADRVYEVLAIVAGYIADEERRPVRVTSGEAGSLSRNLQECYLAHAAAA